MTFKPLEANPVLLALLEKAKGHVMSPAEKAEQRVSWAYGQLSIEREWITKGMVRAVAEELNGMDGK